MGSQSRSASGGNSGGRPRRGDVGGGAAAVDSRGWERGRRTRGVENLTGRAMCACVGQRGCTTTGFSLSKIVLKIKYLKIVPR
jgi:hypothetical protein